MAAITDLSDLVNRYTGGNNGSPETIWFHKVPRTGGVSISTITSGRPTSLWQFDGIPGAGSAPGSGAIPTNSTTGSIQFTNPGGSRQKWLTQCWGGTVASPAGMLIIYDRLFHISGLSGTSTSAQTIQGSPASPALTRNTGGEGNQIWVDIYTQIGATATAVTASYTNSSGTSGRTTTAVTIGGTNAREIYRQIVLPLQAGDKGVQSVQSVTLAATTGTAGDFGITIVKPIAFLNCAASGQYAFRDFATGLPGMPEILTNSCLSMTWIGSNTQTPEIGISGMTFVEA